MKPLARSHWGPRDAAGCRVDCWRSSFERTRLVERKAGETTMNFCARVSIYEEFHTLEHDQAGRWRCMSFRQSRRTKAAVMSARRDPPCPPLRRGGGLWLSGLVDLSVRVGEHLWRELAAAAPCRFASRPASEHVSQQSPRVWVTVRTHGGASVNWGTRDALHRPRVGGSTTECYRDAENAGLHRPRAGGTTTGGCKRYTAYSCQSLLPPTRGRWGARRTAFSS
jgi:hypothetical protein